MNKGRGRSKSALEDKGLCAWSIEGMWGKEIHRQQSSRALCKWPPSVFHRPQTGNYTHSRSGHLFFLFPP
jgi:hypothetical protein